MDHIKQLSTRLSLLYTEDEQFPACVYVFGQKSVGKSLCIEKFIDSHRAWLQSVVVRAVECYTSKILFETVINGFNSHVPSEENNYSPHSKMDSMEDFLLQLSLLHLESSYLIVVESAEKLHDMELNILPVLMKLQEFTGLNISCMLVSHIAMENLDGNAIIKINVPDYSKSDLIEIFASNYHDIQEKIIKGIHKSSESAEVKEKQLELSKKLDDVFYKNYLNTFLNFFFKTCRDITELRSLASKCYPAYYSPVLSGEIKYHDVSNLWRNIQKVLTISLRTSHMRIENLSAKDMITVEASIVESDRESSIKGFAQSLELPYYAKYLLIASFLASHNDAKFDKRLYMKHHGKERKRQQKAKVSEKMNVQFGPKAFTIDRLLAIFYAILDEKVGLTCNLLSQISTLVDLNFLSFVSGENNIMEGTSRLQSTIGMDFAINIGKVVGFNVKQYLTDFL